MEAKLAEQRQTIAKQEDRIHHLETERERIDDDIERHVRGLMDRMDKEVDNMKDDLEHKFALQIAENKRLQNQLQKQKADAEKIWGYCRGLETRIRKVQDEIGTFTLCSQSPREWNVRISTLLRHCRPPRRGRVGGRVCTDSDVASFSSFCVFLQESNAAGLANGWAKRRSLARRRKVVGGAVCGLWAAGRFPWRCDWSGWWREVTSVCWGVLRQHANIV